ncbi:MAG: hypothetical protein ACXV3E_06705, partial [Halobacteriota archaeon]
DVPGTGWLQLSLEQVPMYGPKNENSASVIARSAERQPKLLPSAEMRLWVELGVETTKRPGGRSVSGVLAERGGFEPPIGYEPSVALQ